MNLVYNIVGRLTGSQAHEELEESLQGKAYILRPPGAKSTKEQIFQNAMLGIRRTGYAFESQLLLTRIFEEDDVVDPEEDDEETTEITCLIDELIQFTVLPATDEEAPDEPGSVSLTWRSADDDVWLFVAAPAGGEAQKAAKFEKQVYRCCYERKYRQSSEKATEADLEQFKVHPCDVTPSGAVQSETLAHRDDAPSVLRYRGVASSMPLFREASPATTIEDDLSEDLAARVTSLSVEDATGEAAYSEEGEHSLAVSTAEPTSAGPRQEGVPISTAPTSLAERDQILSETIDLYFFDDATRAFGLQDKGSRATIWRLHGQEYSCWLIVIGSDGRQRISMGIDDETMVSFQADELAITFNYPNEERNKFYTWLLRTTSTEVFGRLNRGFTLALHEAQNGGGSWDKLKADEQDFARDARMTGLSFSESDRDTETEEEDEADTEEDVYSDLGADEDDFSDGEDDVDPLPAKKNSQLAVGYKNDLSFVVRGDMIGVFQSQPGGSKRLKFRTNIQGLKTPDGKRMLEPNKVMLHDQDTSLVIRDPKDPSSLYRLDIPTGRVVDRWKLGEEIDIRTFLPDSKFAQTTTQQTFIGASHNTLFRVDPRERGVKLVESQSKKYAGKVDFTTATTTESGRLAVASGNGQIRLYDQLGKIAKTALPAMGAPIIGIDSTRDGRWLVATTKRFLFLIDCEIHDGQHKGQLGFERSFPKAHQPSGRVLTLKPEHAAYIGEPNFTPAKFNSGLHDQERTIVSSTGPFVIAWNLRQVKMGKSDSYQITQVAESIVADGFTFGGDREIIVVQPSDVSVKRKTELVKPTRESLSMPPTPARKSDIVRTYGSHD